MKSTLAVLLFTFTFISLFGQGSWKKKVVNEILTLNLPANFSYAEAANSKQYDGDNDGIAYGIQYLNSLEIKDERHFEISLKGFMTGLMENPNLKNYNVTVVDTSLAGTKGLLAKFVNDSSGVDKLIYYYVTIANDKFYSFYVYSPLLKGNEKTINQFFRSIAFDSIKIKEKGFSLAPVYLNIKL